MNKLSKNNVLALEYLLESELEDFEENLCKNHVYYRALAALYGQKYANTVYNDLLARHE